jgi:hypothetical protein
MVAKSPKLNHKTERLFFTKTSSVAQLKMTLIRVNSIKVRILIMILFHNHPRDR